MNQLIEVYIKKKNEAINKEIAETLKDDIYKKVYAPITIKGTCHTVDDNKSMKFTVKDSIVKVGDTIRVTLEDTRTQTNAIVDTFKVYKDEVSFLAYPCEEFDNQIQMKRRYRKVPIELTDEDVEKLMDIYKYTKEKQQFSNMCQYMGQINDSLNTIKGVSIFFLIVAIIGLVFGLFASCGGNF